jgi:Fe2+ or Zn2+ uptake regulation protein
MTKQRELIYSIISESCEHLTAQEIYNLAKETMPSIAFGTVYRNLDLMVKANQIKLIEIANDSNRYDKTMIPHDHAICEKCGRVEDIHIGDLRKMLEKNNHIQVKSYNLIVNCICKKCQNNLKEREKILWN